MIILKVYNFAEKTEETTCNMAWRYNKTLTRLPPSSLLAILMVSIPTGIKKPKETQSIRPWRAMEDVIWGPSCNIVNQRSIRLYLTIVIDKCMVNTQYLFLSWLHFGNEEEKDERNLNFISGKYKELGQDLLTLLMFLWFLDSETSPWDEQETSGRTKTYNIAGKVNEPSKRETCIFKSQAMVKGT